jgi:hypothetical protein
MFDVCTTGDTAHINTIFKFLPHTCVNIGASIFFTAAMIHANNTARLHGNGGMYCVARIIAAVKNIDAPMLMRMWQELAYHIDVCCVTHAAHIEHL